MVWWILFKWKKNGKGKKYNLLNGNLIFEGEFKNGKINGKGIEYNKDNGLVEFEGEYLNGEKHGIGKEYKNGNLIFEGYFQNGKKLYRLQKIYNTDFILYILFYLFQQFV